MSSDDILIVKKFNERLKWAEGYAQLWRIVKETVELTLSMRNRSMMLFLDDLPIQLGAYHPVGTNNIVLNRRLLDVVEVSVGSKEVVNALIYVLLLHEYLHALGKYSETEVRRLVVRVAEKCFGKEHAVNSIAEKSPWVLLSKIPFEAVDAPKRVMEIVKDFEATDKYIV